MNAVRSPEDIMPAIPPAGAAAPRVNPLQRIWLREIGMEKLWLKPAPAARQVDAQVVDLKKEASVRPARAERSDPASPVALPLQRRRAQAAPGRTRRRASPRPCAAARRQAGRQAGAGSRRGPAHSVAERARNATLDELREQVVLHRLRPVPGTPPRGLRPWRPAARWLVVGEAPGEQEDRQGQPFVGRSGQLLDAMLSAVGMSRERDVFIANVIKCRPPGNRNPKPEEIAACSPYLMRQIELLKPERILVLGRFAAQTLLGTEATIGSLRGRVHQLKTDAGPQIPVIVSYHPPTCCAARWKKSRAWQDLKLAASLN